MSNKMNKLFLATLISFGSFTRVMACETPTEQNYINFSLAVLYKDNHSTDMLSQKYCFDYFRNPTFGDSPLLQSNDFEQFKTLTKNISNDDMNTDIASSFGENLLVSRMLLPTLSDKIKTEMDNEINSIKNKYNYKTPLPKLDKQENDKIIYHLATIYHNSFSNFMDEFNNTPIFYTILTNRPDILGLSISQTEGKSAFYRPNKDGITPLHLLFSPEVKNQDMRKINDEVLKRIDIYKLIGVVYKGVDYFQFISVMKDNNPDLFNKLYKQFKFETKLNPVAIRTVNDMDLSYIKKLNLIYENNR